MELDPTMELAIEVDKGAEEEPDVIKEETDVGNGVDSDDEVMDPSKAVEDAETDVKSSRAGA